jgi:oxygen-independent coproporphyrinogen-3 oxidase
LEKRTESAKPANGPDLKVQARPAAIALIFNVSREFMPGHVHGDASSIQKPMDDSGGIYLHVPFCLKKCAYCDFFSLSNLALIPDFVHAVSKEITLSSRPGFFDSIYFGGGTPSLLTSKSVDIIICSLFKTYNIFSHPEITLEANPKTLSLAGLKEYRRAGVNRIQLGVQSFQDRHLEFLGRIHSSSEARESLALIRKAGFGNLGLDLIYGLPGQTRANWIRELEEALVFEPEHLSCYLLTYEPGTPLEKDLGLEKFKPLSEEDAGILFTATGDFLQSHGYFQYEISNFAKIDPNQKGLAATRTFRSRHNQKYWRFAPYAGLGPSAHSYAPPVRSWNVRDLTGYLDSLEHGILPVEGSEVLTRVQEMTEAVALGLRTAEGIDIARFNKNFQVSFHDLFKTPLEILTANHLVTASKNHCRLTREGRVLHNSIAGLMIQSF